MRTTWNETLSDGTSVVVRPMQKGDADRERVFIEGLSPKSRYLRFLGSINHPSAGLIQQLTDFDQQHQVALVALIGTGDEQRIIGVSRYAQCQDNKMCECAVTVADEWQGKGLGTLLMRHLIELGRERGVEHLFSVDMAENSSMRALASHLGFKRRALKGDPGLVEHYLELRHQAGPQTARAEGRTPQP